MEALPVTSTLGADAYDLQRFVSAQSGVYPQVLEKLSAGRKRSHWMWFVFPQIAAGSRISGNERSEPITNAIGIKAYVIVRVVEGVVEYHDICPK